MTNHDDRSGNMPDLYDRTISALDGLPDVTRSRPTTIRTIEPLLGNSKMFIVQTFRQREKGDTIFLEATGKEGHVRIVLPPQVADAIARQREGLTTKVRSATGKRLAQERKDAGIIPFQKKRKRG